MNDERGWTKGVRRALALILIMDGIGTALLGFNFLHWQEENGPGWYRQQVLPFFYKWPEPLLRLGGLLQAMVSLIWVW